MEMEVLLGQVLPTHAPMRKKKVSPLIYSKDQKLSSIHKSVRPLTLSASRESSMEKLSDIDTDPGEWVLCVAGSGVMVLECEGSITTLGEALTWGRSRPVLFRALSSDRREARTEAWNRSGSLSSEHSSLLKTSGELREVSSREALTLSTNAL